MTDDLAQQMTDEPDWLMRAVILMVVGAAAALAIQQLVDVGDWSSNRGAGRDAWATGIGAGALAFGFGLSRVRIAWTAVFAVVLGSVAGLIVWWNGQPEGLFTWSGASMVLAIAIAVPLFQVARDEGRPSFPYTQVHGHAWTNVVLWGACWGFTGIVILLSHLLGELFALIGIDVLKDLLNKSWPNALIIGAAFGGALALLRDRDRVVRLLQRVVTSVLSVLAPVLGIALILFIVSLPFTGLNNLWEATKSTTPILMACVIGALILTNAVIGHGPEDEAKNPVLRWSALALGVSILPLAVIAALAMGLRLNQYGLTPDRLWGLVCVVFAVGYGLIYFVAVVRKRLDWAPLIRRDNIRLAFATMAAALVLATPLLGFNAISAGNQVARLQSGKVSVDAFDWAALAFDFGAPGKRAVAELRRSANPTIAKRAVEVAKAGDRYQVAGQDQNRRETAALEPKLRILPVPVALPDGLRAVLAGDNACGGSNAICVVLFKAGAAEAWAMQAVCFTLPTPAKPTKMVNGDVVVPMSDYLECSPQRYVQAGDKWAEAAANSTKPADVKTASARKAALDAGKVEVRPLQRRQLFIGDEPIGDPFE
ncbi:MAG: DUF4153 domain-containing protein [Sphingomonas sp.]